MGWMAPRKGGYQPKGADSPPGPPPLGGAGVASSCRRGVKSASTAPATRRSGPTAKAMGDVYVASEPHRCTAHDPDAWVNHLDPHGVHLQRPVGSIWRCPECGQCWVMTKYMWERVRWWRFGVRRKIKRNG